MLTAKPVLTAFVSPGVFAPISSGETSVEVLSLALAMVEVAQAAISRGTFHENSVVNEYRGREAILSSDQMGQGYPRTDDILLLSATHSDGAAKVVPSEFRTADRCCVNDRPAADVTELVVRGGNKVSIELRDIVPEVHGSRPYYLAFSDPLHPTATVTSTLKPTLTPTSTAIPVPAAVPTDMVVPVAAVPTRPPWPFPLLATVAALVAVLAWRWRIGIYPPGALDLYKDGQCAGSFALPDTGKTCSKMGAMMDKITAPNLRKRSSPLVGGQQCCGLHAQ